MAQSNYKGRDAKVAVLAARFTDDELMEISRALERVCKRARERGGVNYVRTDLVRGAVLDFARWVNAKGSRHVDDAIGVLEDVL